MTNQSYLEQDFEDFMDRDGGVLTLCVIHELAPIGGSRQAMAIVGGISVCRSHFEPVASAIMTGVETSDILETAKGCMF